MPTQLRSQTGRLAIKLPFRKDFIRAIMRGHGVPTLRNWFPSCLHPKAGLSIPLSGPAYGGTLNSNVRPRMPAPMSLQVGESTLRFNYGPNDAALFLALGAAVAEVQALEFHLVHMLGLLLSPSAGSHTEVTAEYFQKTLGTLAKKLRGEVGDPELAQSLEKVVRERNHLIHGFLRTHQWPMSSSAEYVSAIRELDELTKFFRASGDTITMALRKARDLQVFLLKTNPDTGLPEIQ